MRSLLANLRSLVLPFGARVGRRIALDGLTGTITFYSVTNERVLQLDPDGGIRIFNFDGRLVGSWDASSGFIIRDPDPAAGITHFSVDAEGLVRLAAVNGNTVEITADSGGQPYPPKWSGSFRTAPGANHLTPAVTPFTSDDLELRYAAAFGTSGLDPVETMTPPAGYTEVFDVYDDSSSLGLLATLAYRQPQTSSATQTFVSTDTSWAFDNGHTLVFRSDGVTSPSIRSHTQGFTTTVGTNTVDITLPAPAGVALGDALIGIVGYGGRNGAFVPSSWATPTGWSFFGAGFQSDGSGSTQRVQASGVWVKTADADDVALSAAAGTYSVRVNLLGLASATKRFHVAVIAVQDVATLIAGADIRFEPSSRSRAVRAAGLPLVVGTEMNLNFDTISYDPGSCWQSLGAGAYYEVPQSGPYTIAWKFQTNGVASSERFLTRCRLGSVGGAILSQGTDITSGVTGTIQSLSGYDELNLSAGDRLFFTVLQVNGTARAVTGGGNLVSVKRSLST